MFHDKLWKYGRRMEPAIGKFTRQLMMLHICVSPTRDWILTIIYCNLLTQKRATAGFRQSRRQRNLRVINRKEPNSCTLLLSHIASMMQRLQPNHSLGSIDLQVREDNIVRWVADCDSNLLQKSRSDPKFSLTVEKIKPVIENLFYPGRKGNQILRRR